MGVQVLEQGVQLRGAGTLVEVGNINQGFKQDMIRAG